VLCCRAHLHQQGLLAALLRGHWGPCCFACRRLLLLLLLIALVIICIILIVRRRGAG
jgi:hypothetical protein